MELLKHEITKIKINFYWCGPLRCIFFLGGGGGFYGRQGKGGAYEFNFETGQQKLNPALGGELGDEAGRWSPQWRIQVIYSKAGGFIFQMPFNPFITGRTARFVKLASKISDGLVFAQPKPRLRNRSNLNAESYEMVQSPKKSFNDVSCSESIAPPPPSYPTPPLNPQPYRLLYRIYIFHHFKINRLELFICKAFSKNYGLQWLQYHQSFQLISSQYSFTITIRIYWNTNPL